MQPVGRALDVALIIMQSGGSTVMAERTFQNILRGYGAEGISAAWRLDVVTAFGVAEGRSSTVLRQVGPIGINLVRASNAAVLGEQVAQGTIDVAQLDAEIARVKALAPPYGRWATIAAAALTAAFFARLLGGDWRAAGIVLVAAGIGQFFRSPLQALKVSGANATLICALISTCVAALGIRLGVSHVVPATLIASIIYMVPGLALINGFVDVVSQKHLLVGLERIANAVFLFLVLAIAIAVADTFVL